MNHHDHAKAAAREGFRPGIAWTLILPLLWLGCWCWSCLVDADNGGNAGPGG